METVRNDPYALEIATKNVDKSICSDNAAPTLLELLNVNPQIGATASGLSDTDYPSLAGLPLTLNNIMQIKTFNRVPLPPEIKEHFSHVQCHCMMGLFPEIHRAWLTIDSDIYIWTYEEGSDIAYYDGLNDTILCVGLVRPKPGVFHDFIKYLLVLTTSVEIIVLGVTFGPGPTGPMDEIQLIADPVFCVPTDGSIISTIKGTGNGRLFLGSKEGNLYEIVYQAATGWFGKRCKKVNHSTSTLSFLVPSFLNAALTEEDGIVQISIDDSRHILYFLTEKGSIEVYDMGTKGNSTCRVTKVSQSSLVNKAMNAVKTLDSQNFRPVVSISAVQAEESTHVNLVAVTQTGVRFYMSTSNVLNYQPGQRPYTLMMLHVRLPPGYSANVTVRPRMVHTSEYGDRNLVLVSTVDEKDVLWCLSPDLFPFSNSLMEAYTTVPLDGPCLAFAEVRLEKPFYIDPTNQLPPLVVRQHSEPPRKYVVLTAQGVDILHKLRPVDTLRQLLTDTRNPDSDPIKSFFMIQKEEQACATSLILACLESSYNAELAEWATRAFFLHGGEPKLNVPAFDPNQTNPALPGSFFSPNVISTPISGQYGQQQQMRGDMRSPSNANFDASMNMSQQFMPQQMQSYDMNIPYQFSAKHNGLYLYLGRILRPVWYLLCVQKTMIEEKIFLTSTISGSDCVWILSHLNSLNAFLRRNTQLSICGCVPQETSLSTLQPHYTSNSLNMTRQNFTIQDVQLEERQSLTALKSFVGHACHVMGLWRILCEHQFHQLVATLSNDQQQVLMNMPFKDLLLFGHELCSLLISALINTYLSDNASVDSIVAKLRDVCPSLFKNEDAAYSKATEMLKAAKLTMNVDEKEELIVSALTLCKSVAHTINLHDICSEFIFLKAYHAVIDLCISCAKKVDPENRADRFYKDNVTQNVDQEGYQKYVKRMDIYKEMLHMLDTIYSQVSDRSLNDTTITARTGSEVQNVSHQVDAHLLLRQVINDALQYHDELSHVAIYDWMLSKQMHSDVIKISEPSLETYLLNASKLNPDSKIQVLDLLWKFYESNNDHTSAARILNSLCDVQDQSLTLKDRLNYLTRAVMCMRSDRIGYVPEYGLFLRELEDKLEIAKVQDHILNAMTTLRTTNLNKEEAIKTLNSKLFDITELYENFATPFELWESKLAIIKCSGYTDVTLAENIWRNILKTEVARSTGSANEKMGQILSKVKLLVPIYRSSRHCFPLPYIVQKLELLSVKLKVDKSLVPRALLSVGIPAEELLQIYNEILYLSISEQTWVDNDFHLAQTIGALIEGILDVQHELSNTERRKVIALCQDTVAKLLSDLYSKPNTEELINSLRNIQVKLMKM